MLRDHRPDNAEVKTFSQASINRFLERKGTTHTVPYWCLEVFFNEYGIDLSAEQYFEGVYQFGITLGLMHLDGRCTSRAGDPPEVFPVAQGASYDVAIKQFSATPQRVHYMYQGRYVGTLHAQLRELTLQITYARALNQDLDYHDKDHFRGEAFIDMERDGMVWTQEIGAQYPTWNVAPRHMEYKAVHGTFDRPNFGTCLAKFVDPQTAMGTYNIEAKLAVDTLNIDMMFEEEHAQVPRDSDRYQTLVSQVMGRILAMHPSQLENGLPTRAILQSQDLTLTAE